MRHFSKMAIVAFALMSAGVLAEGKRHAAAHVHGTGHLNFAVEGHQIHVELETPGFDILGFESISSDSQRRKLKDVLDELEKDDLWSFTPAASCTLKTASASAGGEHGKDHHDHADDHHAPNRDKHGHNDHHADAHHDTHHDKHGHDEHHADGHHEATHMDIAATYVFECANIARLSSISTQLFQRFGNSQRLKVQGFTDSGQIAGQLSRQQPEVRF